ncbi:MAG: hypothetical protein KC443_14120 [Anaerolineales bacterium]|nr:hypothetical protein [Anaerolineales bacterium]
MTDKYEVGKMPHLLIEACRGDLVVKGWGDMTVMVKGDDVQVDEVDGGLTLRSNGRLRLSVPENSSLAVTHVHGDTIIRGVQGDVSIGSASGDVILSAGAGAKLGDVQGDLSAKNIDGAVSVNNISGDAVFRHVGDMRVNDVFGDLSARGVNGSVIINTVAGDVGLRNVTGDVTLKSGMRDANFRFLGGQTDIGEIQGDVRLYGELAPGKHAFTAAGDIVLRWPVQSPLLLTATAPQISNRLQLEKVFEEDGSLSGSIGEDGPVVSLTANGRIILKDLHPVNDEWDSFRDEDMDFDFSIDLEGLGAQITAQVNQQVARVTAELESKFGTDFSQKMSEKIARQAERAAERAEKAAERARQRVERQRTEWQTPPRRPTPPTPPQKQKKASAEEQLKILKMVEQGLITPDEASMLLEALEN